MSKYINKYIITDILKHSVLGSIVSFLLSIFIFLVIGFVDRYFSDMVNKHYISSNQVGYILFITAGIIFITFLIILYRKIKMQELRKSLLSIILFLSTYILTMLFVVLIGLVDIDLDIDANAVLFLCFLSMLMFSYIIFLLSYIIYIYYQYDSICFNKNTALKRRIIYTVLYVFCSLIFLAVSVTLYFVLSHSFL